MLNILGKDTSKQILSQHLIPRTPHHSSNPIAVQRVEPSPAISLYFKGVVFGGGSFSTRAAVDDAHPSCPLAAGFDSDVFFYHLILCLLVVIVFTGRI